MRDPEQVARAQHAAARLESAWERWRSLQGLADTPAQPVVGYVGYALKEPWGQPRAVIGFSADEAERLAEFLEHGNADAQQAPLVPAYMAAYPVKQQSESGPQPTFTPQPVLTPQQVPQPAVPQPAVPQPAVAQPAAPQPEVAQPAVPPPASPRQSGQRSQSRHARGGQPHLAKPARSREQAARAAESGNGSGQAPDVATEPGVVTKATESQHATEQAPLVDSGAKRSLRASYPVPRVDSASYQEPVQDLSDRGRVT